MTSRLALFFLVLAAGGCPAPPSPTLDAGPVLACDDTRFVGNGTRLGSGAAPLPGLPGSLDR